MANVFRVPARPRWEAIRGRRHLLGGLWRPDIGVLSDEFLQDVRRMKERNLAVELLERLPKGEIASRFRTNFVQSATFSELLQQKSRALPQPQRRDGAGHRRTDRDGEEVPGGCAAWRELGLSADETAFYDALATNEATVRELGDATLKKIAVEPTRSLRKSVTVDRAKREAVRARLRVMVKTLLERDKYPPDRQQEATETVLRQAEALWAEWVLA